MLLDYIFLSNGAQTPGKVDLHLVLLLWFFIVGSRSVIGLRLKAFRMFVLRPGGLCYQFLSIFCWTLSRSNTEVGWEIDLICAFEGDVTGLMVLMHYGIWVSKVFLFDSGSALLISTFGTYGTIKDFFIYQFCADYVRTFGPVAFS